MPCAGHCCIQTSFSCGDWIILTGLCHVYPCVWWLNLPDGEPPMFVDDRNFCCELVGFSYWSNHWLLVGCNLFLLLKSLICLVFVQILSTLLIVIPTKHLKSHSPRFFLDLILHLSFHFFRVAVKKISHGSAFCRPDSHLPLQEITDRHQLMLYGQLISGQQSKRELLHVVHIHSKGSQHDIAGGENNLHIFVDLLKTVYFPMGNQLLRE